MTPPPSAHESERTLNTNGLEKSATKSTDMTSDEKRLSRASTVRDADERTGADVEAQRSSDNGDDDDDDAIYDRFSPRTKAWIVAIVSYAGFIGRESALGDGLRQREGNGG